MGKGVTGQGRCTYICTVCGGMMFDLSLSLCVCERTWMGQYGWGNNLHVMFHTVKYLHSCIPSLYCTAEVLSLLLQVHSSEGDKEAFLCAIG